jgi:CheY-like chemotaxis protein
VATLLAETLRRDTGNQTVTVRVDVCGDMARILIVDDNATVRLATRTVLEADGHDVSEAESGMAVETIIAETPVDLVIVDIYMPGKDGIETIIGLRHNGHEVKIIAVSGSEERPGVSSLGAATRLGADATLTKPFEADELRQAIGKVLGRN